MPDSLDQSPFLPKLAPKEYRQALGRYATGIAVITIMTDDGPIGMTVNSFASVSLNPPLVLWSPDKSSKRYEAFVKAKYFAVHVLSDKQKDVCDGFARNALSCSDFPYENNQHAVPLLKGCVAIFECRQYQCLDGGDHTIILGEVEQARYKQANSLIFAHGSFSQTTNAQLDHTQ